MNSEVVTKAERKYMKLFEANVWVSEFNNYKFVYNKLSDPYNVEYDLSFLSEKEILSLMKKSIKDGVDYVFEACKDKKKIIPDEEFEKYYHLKLKK